MTKDKDVLKTIKADLQFKHVDQLMARFGIDKKAGKAGLRTKRVIELNPDFFPDDFDVNAYDVTGNIVINVKITAKPKV